MKRITYLSIICGLLIALSPAERINAQDTGRPVNAKILQLIADFEKDLNKQVSNDTTGSFSAAIFMGDRIIWSKAFGMADNQRGIAADTGTVYRIGSISKSITSYLMMLMVQNGTLRLDDPVVNYLPEIKQFKQDGPASGSDITFRELADHSSGLPREPELPHASDGTVKTWETKVLNAIPTTTLHTPVGKNFLYSNIGYAILGLAVSRAAHKPFIGMVEEMIFRPHGMTSSFYSIPSGYEGRIAAGYHWDAASGTYSTAASQRELSGRGYRVPNGGVFATANDLARFLISLTADTDLLAKNYRATMQTAQIVERNGSGYGLGLMVTDNDRGIKQVGHNGVVTGFNSYMVFAPVSRMGIVLFRNCDNAIPILESRANALLPRLVKADK